MPNKHNGLVSKLLQFVRKCIRVTIFLSQNRKQAVESTKKGYRLWRNRGFAKLLKRLDRINNDTPQDIHIKKLVYQVSKSNYLQTLKPINQISIDIEGDDIVICSLGNDPHMETAPLDLGESERYWFKMTMDFPEPTWFQLFFQRPDKTYDEADSKSVWVPPGNNRIVLEFPDPGTIRRVRIDPGDKPGRYIVHDFSIIVPLSSQEPVPPVHSFKSYHEWVRCYDAVTDVDKIEIKQCIAHLESSPLISIVIPVYNTPIEFIDKAIRSVRNQLYPNWELCIADDKSPRQEIRDLLLKHAEQDERIKLVFRETNGHISLASNSALELATGEFVGFLDHDDMIPEHALYYVAQAINDNPDVQLLYSDEDKIDGQDRRFAPYFKSDWNPDLFFSHNYVCHFGVYRRNLLTRIGGFRRGVEGSQDYDLVLRCLPYIRGGQIAHIPRVLYHWRAIDGSTAKEAKEKNYTIEAGLKALRDHCVSMGRNDYVVERGTIPNTYRVRYSIPCPEPLVTLIIPTRDRLELLEVCVRSILDKTTHTNYEILIIDNQSVEPETLTFFSKIQQAYPMVRVLRYDHPFNFSAINNFGVKHASGEIIGLINSDIEVISPDWLTEMVSHACRPEIGCVGAKLYYDDDTIQHAGVVTGLLGLAGHSHKHFPKHAYGYFSNLLVVQNLSALTAACLLVRKEIYEQVGGLDEHNLTVAFNDVDFCLKVREAGYRNLWTPYAELYHHESKSRGSDDTPEKRERFQGEINYMKTTWGDKLLNDPYYNPNLTLELEDFSLAWPPRRLD